MKESALTDEERVLWNTYLKREMYFIEKVKGRLEDWPEKDWITDCEWFIQEFYNLAKSIGLVITDFGWDEDTMEPGWSCPANWKQRIM